MTSSVKRPNRKQHLKVADDQLELETASATAKKRKTAFSVSNIDDQVAKAQKQIDELRYKQEELNRQAEELQEISEKKQEFLSGQIEVTEKLNNSLTHIDREIFEMKQEVEDLVQTRTAFANHLKKIDSMDVNKWKRNEINDKLDKALSLLDQVDYEYDAATEYFSDGRSEAFSGSRGLFASTSAVEGGVFTWLKERVFTNAPVMLLGLFAVLAYIILK